MHQVIRSSGAEFIVRDDSVDRESVEWMSGSLFLSAMRGADIGPSDAILDLGVHIGSFSIVAAREKRCRVVGFEPDTASLRIARANVLLNEVEDRVELHQIAVGGREGTVSLYETVENWGHTIVKGGGPYNRPTGRSTEVHLISLEQALGYLGGRPCALVKFNIEGAEYPMFEAAPPAVLGRIRMLVGEVHRDLGDGDIGRSVDKLRQSGFSVDLVPQGEVRAILIARRP